MRQLRGRAHALLAATFVALSGCGGAPPHGASASSGEHENKGSATSAVAVDTSPVPIPESLFAWLRLGSPAKDLPVIAGLLPQNAGEMVEALSAGPEVLAVGFFGPDFAKALDFSKPIDVATAGEMNDEPSFVISIAVKSLEEARRRAAPLFELKPMGVQRYRLEAKGNGGDFLVAQSGTVCELMPAAGAPTTRLVCGDTKADVEMYAPFLTRTLAPQPVESSLRLEITEGAIRRSFSEVLEEEDTSELTLSPVERAGERFGLELVRRFFMEDMRSFGLDMRLGDGEIAVGVDLGWKGASTPITLALLGQPDAPVATPPEFWRLPADTDLALFIQGAKPEEIRPQSRALFHEMFAEVPSQVMSSTIKDELENAFSKVLFTGGSMLVAHGVDRMRALSALEQLGAGDAKAMAEAHRALGGYALLHLNEAPDQQLRASIKEMFRVLKKDYARPGAPEGAGLVILLGETNGKNERAVFRMDEVPQKASDKQPSGSLHFRAQVTPALAYKPGLGGAPPLEVGYETHLWMVPDGTSTWIGIAENEALVREKLRQVLSGEASALLSRRSDLSPLLHAKGAWLGFATLGGATSLALGGDTRKEMKRAHGLLQLLNTLPSRGDTGVPMVMNSRRVAAGPEGGRATVHTRLEAQLPPKAVADLLRVVVLLTQVMP